MRKACSKFQCHVSATQAVASISHNALTPIATEPPHANPSTPQTFTCPACGNTDITRQPASTTEIIKARLAGFFSEQIRELTMLKTILALIGLIVIAKLVYEYYSELQREKDKKDN